MRSATTSDVAAAAAVVAAAATATLAAAAGAKWLSASVGVPPRVSSNADASVADVEGELGELRRVEVHPDVSELRNVQTRLEDGSTLVRPAYDDPDAELVAYDSLPKSRPLFLTQRDATATVHVSRRGIASQPPLVLTHLFQQAAQRRPRAIAQVAADGTTMWTWEAYFAQAKRVGRALVRLGMPHHGAVSILGFNSPEWVQMAAGCMLAGGVAAGIYTTSSGDACGYIVSHSRSDIVAVENEAQLRKFSSVVDKLPTLKAFVVWGADASMPSSTTGASLEHLVPGKKVLTWREFIALGDDAAASTSEGAAKKAANELEQRMARQQPGDAFLLMYTSGTTGNPKAVAISHDNCTWISLNILECMSLADLRPEVRFVSYLPLSHVAGLVYDIFMPIVLTALMEAPASVHFADAQALKGTLTTTLRRAKPTIFFAVPRVFEKLAIAVRAEQAKQRGWRRAVTQWAQRVGTAWVAAMQTTGSGRAPLLWPLARRALLPAREFLGLEQTQMLLVGAAPINPSTLEFLGMNGMLLYEMWGMSELTGPSTWSRVGGLRFGSCGPPMPGTELMIQHVKGRDPPGHGEILARGRNLMRGYEGDEGKSRDAIDSAGWMHSGDVGYVDEYGSVFISGRIKELLVTSGGENVAPVPIEEAIKRSLPALSNVVCVGDRKKYLSLMVTAKCVPNADGTMSRVLDGEAKAVDPACKSTDDAVASSAWRAYVQRGVDAYNSTLAVSGAQKIVAWVMLPDDFSVPRGELGPTLKLKRNVVQDMYKAVIDGMYPKDDA